MGASFNPYPHKFQQTIGVAAFIEKYSYLAADQKLDDVTVSLAGRTEMPLT